MLLVSIIRLLNMGTASRSGQSTTVRMAMWMFTSPVILPSRITIAEAQRIHDQVWQTAEQFSAVGKAHIYLNNVLLGDIVFNK